MKNEKKSYKGDNVTFLLQNYFKMSSQIVTHMNENTYKVLILNIWEHNINDWLTLTYKISLLDKTV